MESLLRATLTAFAHAILGSPWYGKEREAVSYYAFGFLAKACAPGTVLFDPAQIAVESLIPGGPLNKKKEVCKDLAVWSVPGGNCWNAEGRSVNHPLALMEWKAGSASFSVYDLKHLMSLTQKAPDMLAVAVTPPGKVQAKGKGEMEMYFVERLMS
mgnify:CR=1 FL=1